jgi:hypothetical protein
MSMYTNTNFCQELAIKSLLNWQQAIYILTKILIGYKFQLQITLNF